MKNLVPKICQFFFFFFFYERVSSWKVPNILEKPAF